MNFKVFKYNSAMNSYISTLCDIFLSKSLRDESLIDRLYYHSRRSMLALSAFTIGVTYYLYKTLGIPIVVWGMFLVLLASGRWMLVGYYDKHKHDKSLAQWHRLFSRLTIVTALAVSLLGWYFIPHADTVDRLFIIAALMGVTGGAMNLLFPDIRMMLVYVSIVLLPLIVTLFLMGGKLNILLMILLVLYYVTQLIIGYNTYRQNMDVIAHQQAVDKAKNQLYKEREALEYFYKQAPIGIYFYDVNLVVTDCNDAFLELFHLRKEEIVGIDLHILPDNSPLKIMTAALTDGVQHYVGPYHSLKGLHYWIDAQIFPLHDNNNKVVGGVVMIENKTKEHEAKRMLEYLAMHDPLTGLSNRYGFKEYMKSVIKDKKHQNTCSMLFYLDLDRFKQINDSLGHTFGDHLLKAIAKRLKELVPPEANLTRLGGDEFVIVLPFISGNPNEAKTKAKMFAETIHEVFETPFHLDGVRLYIKSSIGIVLIEPGFDNIDEIVRHADISMYQAKKKGEDHISFYNNELDKERKEVFALQQDLIHALEHDAFELYLQPIVTIDNNTVKAAEALIRWHHPEHGIMQPIEFIPLAIELGVIGEIGWWVLDQVCQTIDTWRKSGDWDLEYISINFNAKQLITEDFIDHFFAKLEKYNVNPEDIKMEITETSLIDNFALTQEVIKEMQNRGIKCVIDDFGTGYSSLSYLKKLSFSVLKIDKEFIFDLENDEGNKTLIRTIVEIARQFNYTVVVEGIEKEEQRDIIRKIDDRLSYQGYLVSKPIPIDTFKKEFIKKKK